MMNGMQSALIHSAIKKRTGIRKFLKTHIIAGIFVSILFEFRIYLHNYNTHICIYYSIYVSIFVIIVICDELK